MGAYKKGEIAEICRIVKPDVATVTAIGQQHLALFGSIVNTLKAKYEIIKNSKKDAVVVLNADSDMITRIAGKSRRKEVFYSTEKEVDVWASDIKSSNDGLEFNVHYKDEVKRIEAGVVGQHNVSNILAATAISLQFDISLNEIAHILKSKTSDSEIGRLSLKQSKFGYKIIDDSYNSNPKGFQAALDLLDSQKAERKILVTIGLIELGDSMEEVYKRLSKKVCSVCDVVVTTDSRMAKIVQKKCRKVQVMFYNNVKEQLDFLKREIGEKDIVLFEGPNKKLLNEVLK